METQNPHPLSAEDLSTLVSLVDDDATLADKVAARQLALEVTGQKAPGARTIIILNESGQEEEVPVSHIGHRENATPRLGKDALKNAIAVDSETWHIPKS